jgi:hypothetical protein
MAMAQIELLINEEVERRVDAQLTPFLEYISGTYDISMKQLIQDLHRARPTTSSCQGVAKKGRRCKNRAKDNGFCHMHQSQVPKRVEKRTEHHTHTLPPFYLKGCPVCDAPVRDLTDCLDNE